MKERIHAKPGLYAMYYEYMKEIAKEHGYCLVVHGSMTRDLDLIAIPWIDKPKPEEEMIKEFQKYLSGNVTTKADGTIPFNELPGGRKGYTICLNRGNKHGEWVRFEDKEYYLDISVTPTPPKINVKKSKSKQ